jgi:hypothetical protein
MRMPSASSRANSSAQPGSSTITASPARSSVRLTMSSACVAPTVVTICSGPAGTLMFASLVARLRRRPLSPAGSPYCSEKSLSARVLVTRRTAAAVKGESSHSDGNTPMPGCGLSLGRWNMPRMRVLASAGTGLAADCSEIGPMVDKAGPACAAIASRT